MATTRTALGRRLRAWRLASGMRPEQVCVAADVSYPHLRAIEDSNRINPSLAVLERIARAYGRSLAELFADDDTPCAASTDRAGAR